MNFYIKKHTHGKILRNKYNFFQMPEDFIKQQLECSRLKENVMPFSQCYLSLAVLTISQTYFSMFLNCSDLGLYSSFVNTLLPMRREPPYVTREGKINLTKLTLKIRQFQSYQLFTCYIFL